MDLLIYTLRSAAYAIIEPSLFLVIILLGVMLYIKNNKIVQMQRMIVGDKINTALELTLSQIVLGIFAGAIGSIMLAYSGIVFGENSGIYFLFLLSIILMFIKPRFICFSYSGAILGAIGLILRVLNIGEEYLRVDIFSIMIFVGIFHIVESFLVMFDGDRGAVPVFSNKGGVIVGGYALNRTWVIPVSLLIGINASGALEGASEMLATPSWWPLVSSAETLLILSTAVLVMMPIYGIIGYSSITFTKTKKNKKISSGIYILLFGISLVIASFLAKLGIVGEILLLIYAPLGHEIMLKLQKKKEDSGEAIFISNDEGLSVIEVIPYSLAYKLGIKIGDKIQSVNNIKVNTEGEIYTIIKQTLNRGSIQILKMSGERKDIPFKIGNKERFGFLLVPRFVRQESVYKVDNNKFNKVLDEMINKK